VILVLCTAMLVSLRADPSWAEEQREDHERWVPALGLNFGLEIHDTEASSVTGDILGPADASAQSPIRSPSSGQKEYSSPSLAGTLEIMTPSPFDGWGRPRLFARAGVGAAMPAKIKPSSEGALRSPMLPPPGLPFWFEDEISGQGTRVDITVDELEITAALGVAFETRFEDRVFRIRPSAEFVHREITGRGAVNRAVALQPGRLTDIEDARYITLRAEESKDIFGIGPGIEFEIDAARTGPFMITAYAGGAAYYFVGDLDWDASDTNEFGESAAFDFEVDEWSYRGNAGIRIRWLPE
jgi:hypothetical protein